MKKLLYFFALFVFISISPIFASVYYIEIYNPNQVSYHDIQVSINISSLNISPPIAEISLLNNTSLYFCYETTSGDCSINYDDYSGRIWVRVPYLPAKSITILKVVKNGTNGAVDGSLVYYFYDTFDRDTGWQANTQYEITTYNGASVMKITTASIGYKFVYKSINISRPLLIEARVLGPNKEWSFIGVFSSLDSLSYRYELTERYGWNGNPTALYISKLVPSQENVLIHDTNVPYPIYQWNLLKFNIGGNSLITGCINDYCRSVNDGSYSNFSNIGIVIGANDNPSTFYVDWIRILNYAPSLYIKRTYTAKISVKTSNTLNYTYTYNYLYALPTLITSSSTYGALSVTIPISIDTRTLIANGQLKSDCSDIAITLYNPTTDTEQDLPFWLDPATCNTPNIVIYVKLPVYAISQDAKLFIYFGAPNSVPMSSPNAFYYFVDFSNPSDYSKIQIYTNGTASYNITSNGIKISIGTNGQLVIYNK